MRNKPHFRDIKKVSCDDIIEVHYMSYPHGVQISISRYDYLLGYYGDKIVDSIDKCRDNTPVEWIAVLRDDKNPPADRMEHLLNAHKREGGVEPGQ